MSAPASDAWEPSTAHSAKRSNSISIAVSPNGVGPPAQGLLPQPPPPRRRFQEGKYYAGLILYSSAVQITTTVLTLYVLVGDDIRLVFFKQDSDHIFDWVTVGCIMLFTAEILLSCYVREDYFPGFWFILDVIATVSLIFDLSQVSKALLGTAEISVESTDAATDGDAVSQSEYARASRSSRVGTRVARLLRVVRLIRVGRMMRRTTQLSKGRWSTSMPGEAAAFNEAQAESRVGKELSERTTQRVIVLVLIMLFIVPMLNPGSSAETMLSSSAQYGADAIYQAWQDFEQARAEVFEANSWTPGTLAWQGLEDPRLLELRQAWEEEMLRYIYYHNWHADCPSQIGTDQVCASSFLHKLCFVGYVRISSTRLRNSSLDNVKYGYLEVLSGANSSLSGLDSWDTYFATPGTTSIDSTQYIMDRIPRAIQERLARPWEQECSESAEIFGVSLIESIPCPRKSYRLQETMWFVPFIGNRTFFDDYMEGQFVFIYDIKQTIIWEALLSIFQTIFVVIVLAIGALFFSKDADKLVLQPIERMISKVRIIRNNPMEAVKLGENQYKEQMEKEERRMAMTQTANQVSNKMSQFLPSLPSWPSLWNPQRNARAKKQAKPKKASMETRELENAIIKLGSLLALGFGEAGSEIICRNMADDNDSVNAMIPGSRVEAIYGFCDIRNFTPMLEALQEKTTVFVNLVAEIVHRIVDEHLGAANKNAGEAFLLVWRLGLHEKADWPKIADLAVISFVKVVAELNMDAQLAEYREHPALLAHIPGFRASLGFGLHLGWSYEGAIGSEFKIDASYLSPHVNLASRLEAVTQEYGVSILVSEPLVRGCNQAFRRHLRAIDHVRFQGTKSPMRLFTVDLDHEVLPVSVGKPKNKGGFVNKYKEKEEREQMKAQKLDMHYYPVDVFENDKYVQRMRDRYSLSFNQEFEKGYLNYEAGEWTVAEVMFARTRWMLHDVEDGPSKALLDFIQSHSGKPPLEWRGFRELRER